MKFEILDILAISTTMTNVILSLILENYHSFIGWALAVYLYFSYVNVRETKQESKK